MSAIQSEAGRVISLWRYPVKSMMGEELDAAHVRDRGVAGDRAYALLDSSDGKVATAKNPKKWPNLFAFRAVLLETAGGKPQAVRITLPDGATVTSLERDVSQALSEALNRDVTLASVDRAQMTATSEEYWPDMDGLNYRDTVTDFALPEGTFFDCATIHLLTTATLNGLRDRYQQGRFEVPRFRPNIVVEAPNVGESFPENAWIGHTVAIGDEVRLSITAPCGRCVMTTLAQGDLPRDSGILRTAVQQNQGNVGVYAAVVRGGRIRRGDRVRVEA